MDETTTSTTQDEQTQAAKPQLESQETQAVQEPAAAESPNTQPAEQPSDDKELLDWASKKGISTDDPVKLLKMYRESETKMHQATNEASKLRDGVQEVAQNDGQDDVYQLINRLKVTEFYLNNPNARDYDGKMAEILEDKPYLANDLETLYDLARFKSADEKLVEARQAGKTEALKQITKSELAAPPQNTATTRQTPSDEIPNFTSVEDYEAWKTKTGFDPFAVP